MIKGFPKNLKVKANWGHIVDAVTLPPHYCSHKYLRYGMQKKFLRTTATELSLLFKTTTLLAAFGRLCLWSAIDKDVLFVAFAVSGAKCKIISCLTLNLEASV